MIIDNLFYCYYYYYYYLYISYYQILFIIFSIVIIFTIYYYYYLSFLLSIMYVNSSYYCLLELYIYILYVSIILYKLYYIHILQYFAVISQAGRGRDQRFALVVRTRCQGCLGRARCFKIYQCLPAWRFGDGELLKHGGGSLVCMYGSTERKR